MNEEWLNRYCGWVYGLGFGAQLGTGVLTIVTISAVYVSLLAALLSGSFAVGEALGAALGAARWLSALPGVHAPGPRDSLGSRRPSGVSKPHRAGWRSGCRPRCS